MILVRGLPLSAPLRRAMVGLRAGGGRAAGGMEPSDRPPGELRESGHPSAAGRARHAALVLVELGLRWLGRCCCCCWVAAATLARCARAELLASAYGAAIESAARRPRAAGNQRGNGAIFRRQLGQRERQSTFSAAMGTDLVRWVAPISGQRASRACAAASAPGCASAAAAARDSQSVGQYSNGRDRSLFCELLRRAATPNRSNSEVPLARREAHTVGYDDGGL